MKAIAEAPSKRIATERLRRVGDKGLRHDETDFAGDANQTHQDTEVHTALVQSAGANP